VPSEPFLTSEYPSLEVVSARASLSFGQEPSFEDVSSASGGNCFGQKYHFRSDPDAPNGLSDVTSSNKSSSLYLIPNSEGFMLVRAKGGDTRKGSDAFHCRVSLTSCSCCLVKTERDMMMG
jgi:hypothetical protein